MQLKPRKERKLSAQQVQDELRGKLAAVPGIKAYIQLVQNIQIGGRLATAQYQYTLQGIDQAELFATARSSKPASVSFPACSTSAPISS